MDWGTVGVYAAFGLGYLLYQGWKDDRPPKDPRNTSAPVRPHADSRRESGPSTAVHRSVRATEWYLAPAPERARHGYSFFPYDESVAFEDWAPTEPREPCGRCLRPRGLVVSCQKNVQNNDYATWCEFRCAYCDVGADWGGDPFAAWDGEQWETQRADPRSGEPDLVGSAAAVQFLQAWAVERPQMRPPTHEEAAALWTGPRWSEDRVSPRKLALVRLLNPHLDLEDARRHLVVVAEGSPFVPAQAVAASGTLNASHDPLMREVALLRAEATAWGPRPSETRVRGDGRQHDDVAELLLTQVWRCIDDNTEPEADFNTLTEPYLRLRLRFVRLYRAVVAAVSFTGAARDHALRTIAAPELNWYITKWAEQPETDLTIDGIPTPDDVRDAVARACLA